MPITYRIDRDDSLLTVVGEGEIRDEDLGAYKESLRSDPDLGCVALEICDFREASFSMSPKQIPDVAKLHEEVFAGAKSTKCAVLVASDLQYGLVRMYAQCIGNHGHEVAPFRTVEEAQEWLGISPATSD